MEVGGAFGGNHLFSIRIINQKCSAYKLRNMSPCYCFCQGLGVSVYCCCCCYGGLLGLSVVDVSYRCCRLCVRVGHLSSNLLKFMPDCIFHVNYHRFCCLVVNYAGSASTEHSASLHLSYSPLFNVNHSNPQSILHPPKTQTQFNSSPSIQTNSGAILCCRARCLAAIVTSSS